MGKPVKISDRKTPWYLRGQKSEVRRTETLAERERILIVCEGEKTEPNYFRSIQRELPQHIVELEICGEGFNTLTLVEKAQALRNGRKSGSYPFDQVWVVFDRDSFPPSDFDNAITKAEADNIQCAWSNEALELWYVLHFEYRTTAMPRTEYQDKLSTLIGRTYAKNASDMYQVLAATGSQEHAVNWAKRLHQEAQASGKPFSQANPCTTVYVLIEMLNGFKDQQEDACIKDH